MAVVAWSNFWGDVPGAYSLLINKFSGIDRIQRVVNRDAFRASTALFNGLIGAATGSNVTATHKRIQYIDGPAGLGPNPGGLRVIETVTDINRNTAAADVTALKAMVFNVTERPVPYPRDLSGNGGPALA